MKLEVLAVEGIPEVLPGDDIAELIAAHALDVRDGDVIVVTSKIVSKAERQVSDSDREAAIDAETVRVVARRGDTRVVATRHGFVMAAAGVDASNVAKGSVVMLPLDSDASALRIRIGVRERLGVDVGVIISDTFGRPWRIGVTDVAVGVAGLPPLDDLRGTVDPYGNELQVTLTCTADEIAAAADLVKGKLSGIPVAIVRGLSVVHDASSSAQFAISQVVRGLDDDMFAFGSRDVLRARDDATGFTNVSVDVERVRRALETAALAVRPVHSWRKLQFSVVESPAVIASLAGATGDRIVAAAKLLVVPHLDDAPTPTDLLAAGAAIENVLVALAVEHLGSRWVWPEGVAEAPPSAAADRAVLTILGLPPDACRLGVIAVGHPASS